MDGTNVENEEAVVQAGLNQAIALEKALHRVRTLVDAMQDEGTLEIMVYDTGTRYSLTAEDIHNISYCLREDIRECECVDCLAFRGGSKCQWCDCRFDVTADKELHEHVIHVGVDLDTSCPNCTTP